jgi:hypothetical protein
MNGMPLNNVGLPSTVRAVLSITITASGISCRAALREAWSSTATPANAGPHARLETSKAMIINPFSREGLVFMIILHRSFI